MSFPLVQTGTLTLPTGAFTMCFAQTTANVTNPMFNVAGACEGATSNHDAFEHGLTIGDYVGIGFIKKAGEATYGLGQISTMDLSASMNVQAQNWVVRRWWRLFDVTGSNGGTAATEKEYEHGNPSTAMSVSGVAQTGYIADHTNKSLSVETLISQFGTLAGTLKLANKVDVAPHATGGPVPVRFAGQFSTKPTFTPLTLAGTNDDFEWLLGSSVTAPVEGTLTRNVGDSSNLTPNVLVYDVTANNNARDGGSIQITTRMRVTA